MTLGEAVRQSANPQPNGKRLRRRVVTCQGTIQLVSALAAREAHARAGEAGTEYEDYLVIYDLFSPRDQQREFAEAIARMARSRGEWRRITFIEPERIEEIRSRPVWGRTESLLDEIRGLVGTEEAEEIYLCRSSQFGNQLLMHAYASAERLCYGDAVGVYMSEIYYPPNGKFDLPQSASLLDRARGELSYHWSRVQYKARHAGRAETAAPPLPFDWGYFLLPRAFGEEPPMAIRSVGPEAFHAVFRGLEELLDEPFLAGLRAAAGGGPASVVLTSSFAELGRMTEEDELSAYEEFLERREPAGRTLFIKPHPRDGREKVRRLARRLERLGKSVCLLADHPVFYLPFEVIYRRLFAEGPPPQVFAFSTACLSLEALYGVQCEIGFGPEIVRRRFHSDLQEARLKHERDLEQILGRIRRGEG